MDNYLINNFLNKGLNLDVINIILYKNKGLTHPTALLIKDAFKNNNTPINYNTTKLKIISLGGVLFLRDRFGYAFKLPDAPYSAQRIDKLIDTLGWESESDTDSDEDSDYYYSTDEDSE